MNKANEQHVSRTLCDFSNHIRLTEDEKSDASFVGKRYIAAHMSAVPTGPVFHMIGNDYEAIVRRTHKPPFKNYAERSVIDNETFRELVEAGYPPKSVSAEYVKKNAPSYVRFCDAIVNVDKSKEDDESPWKKAERYSDWRNVAYYLAANFSQKPAQFERLMSVVHGNRQDGMTVQGLGDLIDRARNFDYGPTGAQDVGAILNLMSIPVEKGYAFTTPPQLNAEESAEAIKTGAFFLSPQKNRLVRQKSIVLLEKPAPVAAAVGLNTLRPKMEAYRKRAGLAASVPTERIARQMLLAAIDDQAPLEHVKPVMGRYQKNLVALEGDSERELVAEIVDALPTIPEFNPNKSAHCRAIAHVTMQNEWEPRSLLKHIVAPESHMDARALHKYKQAEIMADANLVKAMAGTA